MQNDLTTGSVFRNVVSFSLPYLLSYFLQTLYGMADLFIIGQFEGVASTTAVSIGSQVMHMLTVMLVGLAMGATVSIAQATGGGDKKRTASAIGNTVTLFMLLSLALTALLLALRGGIVSIMSTPEEAVQGTLAYLTVCFIGIPFITAYNIIASIFRGLGDSKSPMYFIAVACVVNIALDYYFMGTLHLGPAGAALGTTLSQAVSVLVSLAVILKRRLISVRRADFRPQRAVMGKLLQIGVPVALQDGFIQVSFVIITIIAAFIQQFAHLAVVQHAFAGIRVCVCVLIFNAVLKLWKGAVKDVWGLVIFLVILALSVFTKLSPIIYVLAAAVAGLLIKNLGAKRA